MTEPKPTPEDAGLRVTLVGEFTVWRGDVRLARTELGSRKGRLLLKLLAVERSHLVPVHRIAAVLWGDDPPGRTPENVATLVSRLRRDLGSAVIDGGRDGYRLGSSPGVEVDLDVATRWISEATLRLAAHEPGLAVVAAVRALELLVPGAALEDEAGAEWTEPANDDVISLAKQGRHLLAQSALATGDHRQALVAANAALAADPYDEIASRLAMRAHQALGEPARALAVYAELRDLLAVELGADPAVETRSLHLAVLRDEPAPALQAEPFEPAQPDKSLVLVGRRSELRYLREAWNAAAGGTSSLRLVAGEAGIGKTRLADELSRVAASTGGIVLHARCYETERSLFLQPVVEAIGSAARLLSPDLVRAAAGDRGPMLAGLVPEVAAVIGSAAAAHSGSVEVERRRAFEAVAAFVRGISARTPVLLLLDDLQNAGRATVELLHYLTRQVTGCRVLVVATVRAEEGNTVLKLLADVAIRLDIGPLPAAAVRELASDAGQQERTDEILRRTRGHALFVVETLRGLAAGETGVPVSLQDVVLARVARAGKRVEGLLRAGAVLGASFDAGTVARLLAESAPPVAARCEEALAARLLVVSGREYEFANDLVREVLYATTPAPTRTLYHLRAADLLTDRPEAVAAHATAAEDWPRAARAWLLAGEAALRHFAAEDAEELLSRCIAVTVQADDPEVRGRALVARAGAHEARAAYDAAIADLEAAVTIAERTGDRRLEMITLRKLGGEARVALGQPASQMTTHLQRGLQIATSLGDRAMEADLLAWLAVLASNRLRFDDAVEHGRRAVAAARASGSDHALAAALDGQKTSVAYLGEIAELVPVLDELEPLLRRLDDPFRLHWALFESGFPAVAAGDWVQATARFESALEANRRGGFTAYACWHIAHLGWLARLRGDYGRALELGRRAMTLNEQTPHAWCGAASAALLGTTLLESGAVQDAISVLERGRQLAVRDGSESYVLRCLAPLAEATGSLDVLDEADGMLWRIAAPPGSAWMTGDGAYVAVARSWLAKGEPERARRVLAPMLAAARRVPWVAPLAAGCLVDGRAAAALGDRDEARALFAQAAALAARYQLRPIADAVALERA